MRAQRSSGRFPRSFAIQPATLTLSTLTHTPEPTPQVVLGSWCPTMDLLALVGDDGQLAVYRLEWQRLWGAVPDGPVTALAWRPDGGARSATHRLLNYYCYL